MTAKQTPALPPPPAPSLRIVDLKVQNIKRIRAVHITPNGDSTVILGGKNGAGKTSVLDAIQMALGGSRAIPSDPVRHGAKRGSIVADLGDLVVERVIAKDGQTTLTVRDADGIKQRSPQTILDELCSRIAFDPLAFMLMDPAKQNEVLRQLLGLDFSKLDAERERCYSQRTDRGRDAKSARASADSIQVPAETPDAVVSVADLIAQLRAAHEARDARATHERRVAEARAEVERAEHELKQAEARAMAKRMAVKSLEREAVPPAADPAPIERQLAAAESTNRHVHLRGQRDALEQKATALEAEVERLAARIADIDAEKTAAIAARPFPVPGLTLGQTGPMLEQVPLEQASAAQKLRVSVAIGLAMNPRLKVLLVRDASLLDEQSLALVAQMAAEGGAQVWLERVGDGDPTAVVIADGQVVGADVAAPANDASAASA
jgi:chromosome segregation ATPase